MKVIVLVCICVDAIQVIQTNNNCNNSYNWINEGNLSTLYEDHTQVNHRDLFLKWHKVVRQESLYK